MKAWQIAIICFAVFLIFAGVAVFLIANNEDYQTADNWKFSFDLDDIDFGFGIGQGYTMDESQSLDISGINSIDISTVSSDVNITQTDADEISVHLYGEYTSRNGEIELDISQTGKTIKIVVKYPKLGVQRCNLTLDIEIPESYVGDLSADGVSSDVELECEDVVFEEVSVDTVSGTIDINTLIADSFTVNTVSGDIKGTLAGGSLKADGVSSNIYVSGLTDKASVETVSGDITLVFAEASDADLDTVSGNMEIDIMDSSEFYVYFDSVSGNFSTTVPMIIIKQKDDFFEGSSAQNYSAEFNANSVSGDLTITR